jgi:hypothetical protein
LIAAHEPVCNFEKYDRRKYPAPKPEIFGMQVPLEVREALAEAAAA